MSDPTYEVYSGTMRFDDDNIVDVNLEPDTENINVRLNGTEVTIGAELPAVTAADNGDVLTVVEGAWAKAEPAAELPAVTATDNGDVLTVVSGEWAKAAAPSGLPAVTASDNGNVLTVVEGSWAKAAPSGGNQIIFDITYDETEQAFVSDLTNEQIMGYVGDSKSLIAVVSGQGMIMHYYYAYSNSAAEGSTIAIVFYNAAINPANNEPRVNLLNITAAGTISFTAFNINPT